MYKLIFIYLRLLKIIKYLINIINITNDKINLTIYVFIIYKNIK